MAEDKLYILCIVTVLLPDDGDIKSHVHRFTYVVKPRFFGDFYAYIVKTFDFYDIDQVGYLTSSSPKYVHKEFTKL